MNVICVGVHCRPLGLPLLRRKLPPFLPPLLPIPMALHPLNAFAFRSSAPLLFVAVGESCRSLDLICQASCCARDQGQSLSPFTGDLEGACLGIRSHQECPAGAHSQIFQVSKKDQNSSFYVRSSSFVANICLFVLFWFWKLIQGKNVFYF